MEKIMILKAGSLFNTVTYAYLSMEIYWEPAHRGFYCRDPALSYPKEPNTVTPEVVLAVNWPVVVIMMMLLDGYIRGLSRQLMYNNCVVFTIGVGVMCVSSAWIKYKLGMPRPYFLTACAPDYDTLDCNHGYVVDAHCTGNEKEIRMARLSFPSLHSSLTSYAVIYFTVCLHKAFTCKVHSYVLNIMFAFLFTGTGTWYTYVAVTRVLDHRHHVMDVVAGTAWGIVIAYIMIRYCLKPMEEKDEISNESQRSTIHISTNRKTD